MSNTPASVFTDGPFAAYLAATDEKQFFIERFGRLYLRYQASRIFDRPVRVLDLGCGNGATSQPIMKMMQNRGQKVDYFVVDPHQAQLDQFESTAPTVRGSQLILKQGTLESFVAEGGPFDLVIAYQMLYHVEDLRASLQKILGLGREVLIGHHGRRGIHQVQEQFREHVQGGPHVISTDSEVEAILDGLDQEIGERHFERHGFVASIKTSSCFQPKNNRDLAAFFLQCDPALITDSLLNELRLYLASLLGPSYHLPHDVGLFTITDLTHPRFPPV
ncbi:TPA: hypothetical protein DEP96_04145 [Candidatus Uhrbacteria bacterium]|nr:hypothetical protein [Candidatus Uhrbacteria bacterium]